MFCPLYYKGIEIGASGGSCNLTLFRLKGGYPSTVVSEALKLVPQEGFEPSRITRSKRGSSASFLLSTTALKLVALKGVAPSRIIAFEASRSAISGYPQGHLKLVQAMGLEPT